MPPFQPAPRFPVDPDAAFDLGGAARKWRNWKTRQP